MSRLLAIDAGTSAVTAIVHDRDLRPIARRSSEFPQIFPRPGEVEHRAEDITAVVDAVVKDVLEAAGPVDAVGLTVQRETLFALDRATGRAIGTGLVWQDRRTASRCRALREAGEQDRVRRLTGLVLDPYFSATKAEWLLENRADVRRAADERRLAFCTVDALLIHHLTRGEVLATDPTNASRTLLFDIERRQWSEELCALFDVPVESLPEVRPSAGTFGTARLPDGSDAPITGVAGDQQAALFGQGCWEDGTAKNTYGTGCFLLLNTGSRRVESSGGLLTTVGANRRGEPCFVLEGSVFAGGLVVQWLRDGLGLIDSAAESDAVARSVEDSHGVVLVPAFAGLGAPYWDAEARAALVGLTRGAGRAHVVRAGLESIAFQCVEVIELLREETGLAVDELLVDGGASANDFLMQCQADLGGLRVLRPQDVETTARGASALAGLGAGVWSDPASAAAFGDEPARFEPGSDDAERARRLAEWRAAVARVRSSGG